MSMFHADDYVHFLQHVTPDNQSEYARELQRYNAGKFKHDSLNLKTKRFHPSPRHDFSKSISVRFSQTNTRPRALYISLSLSHLQTSIVPCLTVSSNSARPTLVVASAVHSS
jgi:hypothetical protein